MDGKYDQLLATLDSLVSTVEKFGKPVLVERKHAFHGGIVRRVERPGITSDELTVFLDTDGRLSALADLVDVRLPKADLQSLQATYGSPSVFGGRTGLESHGFTHLVCSVGHPLTSEWLERMRSFRAKILVLAEPRQTQAPEAIATDGIGRLPDESATATNRGLGVAGISGLGNDPIAEKFPPKKTRIVTIKKQTLREALDIGETEFRQRLTNGEIKLAGWASKHAKEIKVDIFQFREDARQLICKKLGLDTLGDAS